MRRGEPTAPTAALAAVLLLLARAAMSVHVEPSILAPTEGQVFLLAQAGDAVSVQLDVLCTQRNNVE